MTDQPLLDEARLAVLVEEFDGDAELLGAVLDTYLAELDGRVAAIRAAAVAADERLAEAAHSLKSASVTIGASAMGAAAARMEAAGRVGDATSLPEALATLLGLVEPTRRAIVTRRG